ncbi:MAG: hypothetical protein WCG80_01200 [Spirochaetales bacterium]
MDEQFVELTKELLVTVERLAPQEEQKRNGVEGAVVRPREAIVEEV